MSDRTADTSVPIHPLLAERWSPRAYDAAATIPEATLTALIEAARWAPSAFNDQPWRFLVARRGTSAFEKIVASMQEFNRMWAASASALIVTVAVTESAEGKPRPLAPFELGMAVGHLLVQAQHEGYITHQMSGFEPDAVRAAFALADGLQPVTIVAVGSHGDPAALPDSIRGRENTPRARKPLADILLATPGA